jgi:hypothetical protein
MVVIKDASVKPIGMLPQLVLAMMVIDGVLSSVGVPLVITSMNDGGHMRRSRHYEGAAFDFRLPSRTTGKIKDDNAVWEELKSKLGWGFDVVLEGDHFHIEWDPKDP